MSVEDELEIRNLLARISHITDGDGSMTEYLTLWTEDCKWESPVAGSYSGHEEQLARHAKFRAMGIQGPGVSAYHVLTTVYVHIDGDAADAHSTWLYVDSNSETPTIRDIGTYRDVLRRTPERWKLVTRTVSQGAGAWLREHDTDGAAVDVDIDGT
jgi:hypothetical protein